MSNIKSQYSVASYYFRYTTVVNGKRRYVSKSLKTTRQLIALQRQKMLDEEIEMGFNPVVEDWDITDFLEKKKKRKRYQEWQDQLWFPPLIATYFFTGMRRSEAIALKGENIIGELQGFYIDKQKGYKERIIPISKYLRPYLNDFLKNRWPLKSDDFILIDGKGDPLTGSHVLKVFNEFLDIAGIPKDRTIHGMRHASVTRWIEMGFSLSEAKDMAGHSSASVTDRMYTHLAGKVFMDKMNKLEGGEE